MENAADVQKAKIAIDILASKAETAHQETETLGVDDEQAEAIAKSINTIQKEATFQETGEKLATAIKLFSLRKNLSAKDVANVQKIDRELRYNYITTKDANKAMARVDQVVALAEKNPKLATGIGGSVVLLALFKAGGAVKKAILGTLGLGLTYIGVKNLPPSVYEAMSKTYGDTHKSITESSWFKNIKGWIWGPEKATVEWANGENWAGDKPKLLKNSTGASIEARVDATNGVLHVEKNRYKMLVRGTSHNIVNASKAPDGKLILDIAFGTQTKKITLGDAATIMTPLGAGATGPLNALELEQFDPATGADGDKSKKEIYDFVFIKA